MILVVILMTFLMMRRSRATRSRSQSARFPPAIQANLDREVPSRTPWYNQYAYYVKGVFTFDLGPSLVLRNQTVNDIVKEHFPVSSRLGLFAFIWSRWSSGIPLGMLAALEAELGFRLHGDDAS